MPTHNDLRSKLEILYLKKQEIEEEIASIESELLNNFSTNQKIEIFYDTFLKCIITNVSNDKIKNHLLGIEALNINKISIQQSNFINFYIHKSHLKEITNILEQKSIYIHYENISDFYVNCWCFFEQCYDNNMLKIIEGSLENLLSNIKIEFFKVSTLPLSLKDIERNFRLFINSSNNLPYTPQWGFLKNIKKTTHFHIQNLVNKISHIVLNDNIQIPLNINFQILNELKAFLTFENPTYQTLLKLRKPIYNTPKLIKNFTQSKTNLILPKGIKDKVIELFKEYNQPYKLIDNRIFTPQNQFSVKFELREEQQKAIENIITKDYGICVAPPGFGKTLIGAKMIELRGCSTLILVNKNMLLDQWIQRLSEYTNTDKQEFGFLGKSKNALNGKIDIATIQSIKNNEELITKYSFLIVDECHHIPAYSFETLIKKFNGKYILGLSATPHRKDALEPLLFHQVGEIVYEQNSKPKNKTQIVHLINSNFNTQQTTYSDILTELINDKARNHIIIDQILKHKNRNIILLSDRVEHIDILEELLKQQKIDFITIHGSQSKKEQNENKQLLSNANLILSSSAYFGEGVDLEHLDTIIFATPISYYGRIIQYLGRVGRGSHIKDTLCIDILDTNNPILSSTFKKRKEGFVQLGYKVVNISLT